MEDQGTAKNSVKASHTPSIGPTHEERSFWIYTGYVAAGLCLLGVLAYHFSTYVLK